MSYLVFARKWRPSTFDDVVGQEHITDTLKKAIVKNRIAHAYIFSGTRGVGKTTTARILARALNCEKGPTPNPCGTCDSCKGIVSGSSFDVREIDGASNNSVDDIRELRENVGYASMGGKYRIYVIDEVHMLSKPAFNALLKTLEEPPPNVIFIFATTEPQKIPATIHSRCQRFDFRRIVPEQIFKRLHYICGEEKIAFEKNALMLIARKADGSMRDALSLLDQVCSYCQGNLTEQEVRIVLGLVGREVYERIMDAVAAKTPVPALASVQQVLYEGYDLHEFVVGFEEHVRNVLFARLNGALQGAGITMEPEILTQIKQSSERFTEGDLLRMMEIIRRAEGELKWSAHPRFAVEMMLLKLVFLDGTVLLERVFAMSDEKKRNDISTNVPVVMPVLGKKNEISFEALKNDKDLKKKAEVLSAGIVTRTPKEVTSAVNKNKFPSDSSAPQFGPAAAYNGEDDENSDHAVTLDTIPANDDSMGQWHGFINSLMRDRPNIGTFLSLATVTGNTDSSIDLSYPHNLSFQFGEVTKKQHRDEIGNMLNAFLGRPVELRITLETGKTEKPDQNSIKPAAHAVAIESEIEHEPIIQSVLDIFDGEVLR